MRRVYLRDSMVSLLAGCCKSSKGRAFTHNIDGRGGGLGCPSTIDAHSEH